MNVNDQVSDVDGHLQVTLLAFDPMTGEGQVRIEALNPAPHHFFVTICFSEGGEHRIDYKNPNMRRQNLYSFCTNRNNTDAVRAIRVTRVTNYLASNSFRMDHNIFATMVSL